MNEQKMYDALPSDKQAEFDRWYRQAEDLAKDIRADTERLESLCAAAYDIVDRKPAADYDGPRPVTVNREPSLPYA